MLYHLIEKVTCKYEVKLSINRNSNISFDALYIVLSTLHTLIWKMLHFIDSSSEQGAPEQEPFPSKPSYYLVQKYLLGFINSN